MKVFFYGSALEYTNNQKLYEPNECASVQELITKLNDQFGERFKDFLLGEENCFFLVNGTGLMMTGGLNTKLKAGDKIEILPFADAG